MDDKHNVSRRGVLAATAGLTVGAGVATVAGVPAAAADSGTGQGFAPMGVGVAFGQWGTVYIGPGVTQDWWFTWYFSSSRWSRMSALPTPDSPANSSIQIVTEWANSGTLWVRFHNNGAVGVVFRPTVIIAPE